MIWPRKWRRKSKYLLGPNDCPHDGYILAEGYSDICRYGTCSKCGAYVAINLHDGSLRWMAIVEGEGTKKWLKKWKKIYEQAV